jgi:CDP-diacylglycerol--serine O-phosphatidyltransferase
MKKHIPNIITLGNLTCGLLSIWASFVMNDLWLPSLFIFLGLFLDFFDGFFARILKVDGELGKQLDSLADMVTFGVAPAVIVYNLVMLIFQMELFPLNLLVLTDELNWHLERSDLFLDFLISEHPKGLLVLSIGLLPAVLVATSSAIRLAKFNISTNQSDGFIGLPTPANAIFLASLPILVDVSLYQVIQSNGLWMSLTPIIILIIAFSLLLNANIPLIALKFKSFGWQGNEVRFIFLGLCVVTILLSLLISNVFVAVPIIILLYLIISIINNITKRKNEIQSKH